MHALKYLLRIRKDVKRLERKKQELEHMNEVRTCEKLKIDEKVLVLYNELDTLKDLMNKKEEVFNTDLSKLEEESRELKPVSYTHLTLPTKRIV